MSVLEDLIVVASVGTSRKEPVLPRSEDSLGEVFGVIAGAAPESRLLGAIAIASQYEACGRLPQPAPQQIDAAAEEIVPASSRRAGELLGQILAMPNTPTKEHLTAEWLGFAIAGKKRVPHRYLPALLHEANRNIRPAIVEAGGVRGAWLMRANPRWQAAAQEQDPQALWSTGTRDQRLAVLVRLRNQDPAKAQELIASTWSEDSADDRAAFVAAMGEGLGGEDEAFLELALDDRSKQVRAAAAELLATVPRSAYVGRMIERAEAMLKLQPTRGRKSAVIEVTLPPDKLDAAWVRDGIVEKPQGGMGRRQAWLMQVAGSIPPTHWSQKWGLTPAECVAAPTGEFAEVLLAAWNRAATRYPEPQWIAELLRRALREHRDPLPFALLNALPYDQQQALTLEVLETRGFDADGVFELIQMIRFGLNVDCARALFQRIESPGKAQAAVYSAVLSTILREAAIRLPPEFHDELAGRAGATLLEANRKALDELLQILLIRRDFRRELQT